MTPSSRRSAIPIITRHTPVRRALSHSESVAGFEGSYVHAQEPDGAIGAMGSKALRQLTAYMTTLDSDDLLLERLAVYRQLKRTKALSDIDGISEGQFVQTGKDSFPKLLNRLERGRHVFTRDCQSCHQSNFGTNSDEDMFPFSEVGTFFSPSLFQRKHQSIRTALLRNLYWVEPSGLLHDGHVKSLEDLVSPDRCDEKTELYRKYYTLHAGGFRIPKGTPAQEAALRHQNYFVDVSWDDKTSLLGLPRHASEVRPPRARLPVARSRCPPRPIRGAPRARPIRPTSSSISSLYDGRFSDDLAKPLLRRLVVRALVPEKAEGKRRQRHGQL